MLRCVCVCMHVCAHARAHNGKCVIFSIYTHAISMSPVLTYYTCAILHNMLYLAYHNVLYQVC